MHLSLSKVLISTYNNQLTTLLILFKCPLIQYPSFILRLNNISHMNNLLTSDFECFKTLDLFQKSFVLSSTNTLLIFNLRYITILSSFPFNPTWSSLLWQPRWCETKPDSNPLIYIHQQIFHFEFPQKNMPV